MVLIEGFVAVGNISLLHLRMAANIDDRGEARFDLFGQIKICRHVQMRHRLEVQIFHNEIALIDLARDCGVQIGLLRHRPKPKHLGQLLAILLLVSVPVIGSFDFTEAR